MRTLSPPTVESARERIPTCAAAARHTLSLARAPSAQASTIHSKKLTAKETRQRRFKSN